MQQTETSRKNDEFFQNANKCWLSENNLINYLQESISQTISNWDAAAAAECWMFGASANSSIFMCIWLIEIYIPK